MKALQPLTFDEFRQMVADLIKVDVERVTPDAYLITELGVDSVRLVELLLRLEKMGIEIFPELAYQIQTVGDAYQYYQTQAGK